MFTGVYNRDEGRVRGFLWKDLKDCKQKWDFPQIVRGDFNMILNRYEKSGEHFLRICADKFKKTLDRLDLMNFPITGGKQICSNQKLNLVC